MTETPPLPSGEYSVIYADPPWSYYTGDIRGGASNHYDTMDLDDIKTLPVEDIVADDAILYLWTTCTHALEAGEVLESWGFEYKTQAVWDKQQAGVGFWFRGQHELLYVATRGDVSPPDPERRRSSVFEEARTEHSAKPKIVRRHIEQAHPECEKVELFSRDNRVGWEVWGDEVSESAQDTLDV